VRSGWFIAGSVLGMGLLYNPDVPYLIDGHNLIPKLGLDISSLDDEEALIARLNEYCRFSRIGLVEVYFDNGRPAQPENKRFGLLNVHFVRRPMIADEAIRLRLKKLKNAAKNWVVISSDHRVQSEAKAVGAKFISSDEFALKIMETLRNGPPAGSPAQQVISQSEVAEWLIIFGENPDNHKKL
jgi:predicted RNA-binding protein with PIN domain